MLAAAIFPTTQQRATLGGGLGFGQSPTPTLSAVNAQEQLSELERLAGELDVDVSYEPMAGLVQGVGGLCRVRGRYRIIVDRKLKPPERLQIVADALRRFDTEDHFVSPQVRRLLG